MTLRHLLGNNVMIDIIGKGKRFMQRIQRKLIHMLQTMLAKRHYYTSLQSYVFECPDKAEILSIRTESTKYAINNNGVILVDGGQVIVKLARIYQATCFVYSDIVLLDDGRCIYDLKELDFMHSKVDFSDEILLKDTKHWCKLRKCHQIKQLRSAIKIGGMFGFNYYHFVFQILPKLFETSKIDKSVPILLDRAAADFESMRQLVSWCNAEGRDIIYMDYDIAYRVKDLYTISAPNVCVPNWKKRNISSSFVQCAYSPNSIENMAEMLLANASNRITPEKIFICRGRASKRRRYNEHELLDLARNYGFEPIYPEELPIDEQINIYHRAKVIIAAGGAALCNLIYCQPGCKLIIFCGSRVTTSLFSSLMLMKGGKVIEIYNDRKSKGYQGDFHINLIEFEKAIQSVS